LENDFEETLSVQEVDNMNKRLVKLDKQIIKVKDHRNRKINQRIATQNHRRNLGPKDCMLTIDLSGYYIDGDEKVIRKGQEISAKRVGFMVVVKDTVVENKVVHEYKHFFTYEPHNDELVSSVLLRYFEDTDALFTNESGQRVRKYDNVFITGDNMMFSNLTFVTLKFLAHSLQFVKVEVVPLCAYHAFNMCDAAAATVKGVASSLVIRNIYPRIFAELKEIVDAKCKNTDCYDMAEYMTPDRMSRNRLYNDIWKRDGMKIMKMKSKMTMGHVLLKEDEKIGIHACWTRNHVHEVQPWYSMCLSPLPEQYTNPGWFYKPMFQDIDKDNKILPRCHGCSQLLMETIPRSKHVCLLLENQKIVAVDKSRGRGRGRAGRGFGHRGGIKRHKRTSSFDESDEGDQSDNEDEPISLEEACNSKGLVHVPFDKKLLKIGSFVAFNFGKYEPDWVIGHISQELQHSLFTHEVTYGDGIPGDDEIRRDQRLCYDDKKTPYFQDGKPTWGCWTFLEPSRAEVESELSEPSDDE